jgi:hypothetical protein
MGGAVFFLRLVTWPRNQQIWTDPTSRHSRSTRRGAAPQPPSEVSKTGLTPFRPETPSPLVDPKSTKSGLTPLDRASRPPNQQSQD